MITQRKSRRHSAVTEVTDLDFADDIALLSNVVDQALTINYALTEMECTGVGLQLNPKKTEAIKYNSSEDSPLKTWKEEN